MAISGSEKTGKRLPKYRHAILWISAENRANSELGVVTAADASAIINEQYELGYDVFETHSVGRHSELLNAIGVLYIFKLRDV